MSLERSLPLQFAAVVALWVVVVLLGLGLRGLWNPVEPRYVGIGAELARAPETWVVPNYNGRPYDQKPPLFFWSMAGLLRTFGDPEQPDFGPRALLLARLPSALGALLLQLAVLVLGRAFFGSRAGLLAALVAVTMWGVFLSARQAHMDVPLAASVAWGLAALWRASEAQSGLVRRAWILVGSLALTAGVFLKGPVAPAFAGAIWVAWAVALAFGSGGAREAAARVWCSGLPFMLVVSGALGVAWFLVGWSMIGDGWAEELGFKQAVGRLWDTRPPKKHSAFYYPTVFWAMTAPWGLFTPVALWSAWRRSDGDDDRRGGLLCTLWIAVVVVVLSFGETARSRYLIPALPAVALLVGRMLDRDLLADTPWRPARLWARAILVYLLAAVCLVAGAALLAIGVVGGGLFDPGEKAHVALEAARLPALAGGPLLVGLGIAAIVAGRANRWGRAVACALLTMCVVATYFAFVVAPSIDRARGDGELVDALQRVCAEGRGVRILGLYGARESAAGYLGFHAGATCPPLYFPQFFPVDLHETEPLVLIVQNDDNPSFLHLFQGRWHPVRDRPFGHHKLWLYVNEWPR